MKGCGSDGRRLGRTDTKQECVAVLMQAIRGPHREGGRHRQAASTRKGERTYKGQELGEAS